MLAAMMLYASLGKWRYFISGSMIALLFGVILRSISRLTAPFGERCVFTGTVTDTRQIGEKTALTVDFSDSRRLHHTAAFLSELPAETGSELRFAVRREAFAAGTYPQTLADAEKAGSDILSYRAHKALLRRQFLRSLGIGLCSCGITFLLFLAAMKYCFP